MQRANTVPFVVQLGGAEVTMKIPKEKTLDDKLGL